ncbi:MAG: hypothetical protein IJ328_01010 [Muribaculaceae bacterium]|nr:hypothetical protein [Muribaculaceae bacterium]
MKKYILMLAVAFAAVFSSCTNDEIPVQQSTSFKINLATVVDGFASIELSPGELTTPPFNSRLRVCLLVYNKAGVLVNKEIQYAQSYSQIISSKMDLSEGDYTILVITDVDLTDEIYNRWKLEGEENLATTKIVGTGYIKNELAILGIKSQQIKINSNDNIEYKINVEPAGAIIRVDYYNCNKWDFVESYELAVKQISSDIKFDSNGEPQYSIETSDVYKWRINSVDTRYEEYYNGQVLAGEYRYSFSFPQKNAYFRFEENEIDGDESYSDFCICDINKGWGYIFEIDTYDLTTQWYYYDPSADRSPENKGLLKGDLKLQMTDRNLQKVDLSKVATATSIYVTD